MTDHRTDHRLVKNNKQIVIESGQTALESDQIVSKNNHKNRDFSSSVKDCGGSKHAVRQGFFGQFAKFENMKKWVKSNVFGQSYLMVTIFRGISVPVRYILNWLVARLYGAFVVGAFSTTRAFLDIIVVIAGFGADKTMIHMLGHAYVKGKKEFIKTFSFLLVIFGIVSVLAGGVVYWLAPFISNIYNKPQLTVFFQITAITIPVLLILILLQQAFRASKHPFWASAFETVLYNILVVLAIVVLYFVFTDFSGGIYSKYVKYGFHLGFLIATGLSMVFAFIVFMLVNKFSFLDIVSALKTIDFHAGLARLLNIGWTLTLVNIVYLILLNLDRIILPKFVSTEQVGVYYIATKIGSFVQIISMAFLTITPPHISKIIRKSPEMLVDYIKKVTYKMGILTILAGLFAVVTAQFWLSLLGKDFVSGVTIVFALVIAMTFYNLGSIAGQAVILIGEHKKLLKGLLLVLFISIFVFYVLGSLFETSGIAVSVVFLMIMQAIVHWYILLRHE